MPDYLGCPGKEANHRDSHCECSPCLGGCQPSDLLNSLQSACVVHVTYWTTAVVVYRQKVLRTIAQFMPVLVREIMNAL